MLFDLDGTIIDSIALILASYRHTLTAHGFAQIADADWMRGVGTPLRVQLTPWARSPEHLAELALTYREHNLAHHDQMITAYPGVVELVRQIQRRGLATGVVTSKNREGTRRGLALVGLDETFDVLVCADDVVQPKPHPEPVLKAVAQLGADPATTLFVGDSIHDLHSGRAAGVLTGAVLWGPFTRADLASAEPDFWFSDVAEMEKLVADEEQAIGRLGD